MRLPPNTAFEFFFWVQKSLIHAATTNPHTGSTGHVEADFKVFVAKPGAVAFVEADTGHYTLTEMGRGWYKVVITTLTSFIDATEGPGILSIRYEPGALPGGFNNEDIWEAMYNVGNDFVNVVKVSGDSTAADNLEAQFDGTGYVHATAPSTQSAVAALPTASANATAGVAALMAHAHDTGVTIGGLLTRLEALVSGKATGLKSGLVRFFRRDGITIAMEMIQDLAAGNRATGTVNKPGAVP